MTQTVPTASIVCMAVSGAVALLLPIVLYILVRRRYKARVAPLLAGAAVFVLFALVLEQLASSLLFRHQGIRAFLQSHWWAMSLYGGLMAGLFEETGRLCAFSFLLRRRHSSLGGALAYGVGHGGIEAILLCTASMVSNIVLAAVLNGSGVEGLLALAPGQQTAMTQVAATLSGTAPHLFLVSALERIIAVATHLALSVLVWMAASGRGPWGLYFLAILFHTIINFPAGMYSTGILGNVWLVEGILAVLALAICVATAAIYEKCSQGYTALLHYEPTDFGL